MDVGRGVLEVVELAYFITKSKNRPHPDLNLVLEQAQVISRQFEGLLFVIEPYSHAAGGMLPLNWYVTTSIHNAQF